jgi:replicative DNA helicase
MDSLVVQLLDRVTELHENGAEEVTGVRTGYFDLDRMTAGFQPGDLIVLAARPSMGKTALALNIAEHVAVHEGLPVVVFSMEMGASQLALRVVGSLGRIDQQHLRTGRLRDDEWERLPEAASKLSEAPMFIDETPGLNPAELRARARRLARQYGGTLGLIVIDYLQLIEPEDRKAPRQEQVAQISRRLKFLARELQIPVVALAQVNRGSEDRQDHTPRLSDLRESGSIEQDADTVLMLHRPARFDKSQEDNILEVHIAKQRNGPTGQITLTYLREYMRYENYAADLGTAGYP